MIRLLACSAFLALSACASAPAPATPGAPDLTVTPGLPAPAQAKFYADCFAQAAARKTYFTERDGGTLRFTCSGDVARDFYDALGPWSAKAGSQYVVAGKTMRFTKKLIKDAYGVDFCATAGDGQHTCTVILNTGAFIEER